MSRLENKIWVVAEDNPWPDRYIPVFIRDSGEDLENRWKIYKYRIFKDEESAIDFASRLQYRYGARYIRMFYQNGASRRLVQ